VSIRDDQVVLVTYQSPVLQPKAGEVTFIKGEEEFDLLLAGHPDRLIVLEASLTWCRPCKGFERAYQVMIP
jgi:thiol:disulfide interchange protein